MSRVDRQLDPRLAGRVEDTSLLKSHDGSWHRDR